jgi:hypothetical protein
MFSRPRFRLFVHGFRVIFLKKGTPRYSAYFTNEIFPIFNVKGDFAVCEGGSKRKAQIATEHAESDVKNKIGNIHTNVTLRCTGVTFFAAG